jgi:hypothetical protein
VIEDKQKDYGIKITFENISYCIPKTKFERGSKVGTI